MSVKYTYYKLFLEGRGDIVQQSVRISSHFHVVLIAAT